jgi:hypothetical protein
MSLAATAREGSGANLKSIADLSEDESTSILNGARTIKRRVHLVETRDTLHSIAERYYDDARVAWLIADLNSPASVEHTVEGKRVVELKERQPLELPEAAEVSEFLSGLSKDFDIDSCLITVINEAAVSAEILMLLFGHLIAGCASNGVSLKENNAENLHMQLPVLTILGSEAR